MQSQLNRLIWVFKGNNNAKNSWIFRHFSFSVAFGSAQAGAVVVSASARLQNRSASADEHNVNKGTVNSGTVDGNEGSVRHHANPARRRRRSVSSSTEAGACQEALSTAALIKRGTVKGSSMSRGARNSRHRTEAPNSSRYGALSASRHG